MYCFYRRICFLSILLSFGFICNCREDKSNTTTNNCGVNITRLHQPCTTTSDCDEGQDCRIIDRNQKTCEIYCNSNVDCPQGYLCYACQQCDWNPHTCFNVTKLHQPCTTESDCCDGQDCINLPSTSENQKTCDIYCNSDSDCPIGYHCNVCPPEVFCFWDPHRCEVN